MQKRNKKSRRSGRQGNQKSVRKAFKVERLEASQLLTGDLYYSLDAMALPEDDVFGGTIDFGPGDA